MTDRLEHEIRVKRRIYNMMKRRGTHLRDSYIESARKIQKNTQTVKRNYEIRLTREVKPNPNCFFRLYGTRNRNRIVPLKTGDWELIEGGKDMSKAWNM